MGGHTRRALGIDGLHCVLAVVKRMKGTNIFLIGLMAVGKSTVGKALSEHLQRPFFDSQAEIMAATLEKNTADFNVKLAPSISGGTC